MGSINNKMDHPMFNRLFTRFIVIGATVTAVMAEGRAYCNAGYGAR
jgi:hypothetical protein